MFYIQWHLTDRCNLSCKHCYQDDKICQTMSYEDAMASLNKLSDYLLKNGKDDVQINLTGGEPLLYPQLFSLVDEIKKRGYRWALLTNGLMLCENPHLVEQIKDYKPVFVQVSLEGKKEMNDAIRGAGTFDKICKAMDLLVLSGIKCLVSFTVNAKNYREFTEVVKICKEHKVHKLWCDRYVGKGELALSTKEYTDFLGVLKKEHEKSMREIRRKKSVTKIAAERSLQFLAGGGGYTCGAGGDLLVLLPDGTLLPCRRLPLPLGNLLKQDSVVEILEKSEIWKELNRPVYSKDCLACNDFSRCMGGAKCVTFAQKGYFHGKDVNCPNAL